MQYLAGHVSSNKKWFIVILTSLPPDFKTRPFKPRVKKLRPCVQKEEVVDEPVEPPPAAPKLAMKDTELMKMARDLYEQDMDKPTLEPLPTHFRS